RHAAAFSAWNTRSFDHPLPGARERAQNFGNWSDDGARPGRIRLSGHSHARFDQSGRNDWAAHVRLRLRIAKSPRRSTPRLGLFQRRAGEWESGRNARGAATNRSRRRLGEDVWIEWWLRGCYRQPDIHIRGDEGGG